MNKLFCLIGIIITCGVCTGQSLVPNGDFEQYSSCPTNHSQLNVAVPWINPAASSPDYYNQCSPFDTISVPINWDGNNYLPAHSGVGYAGIYLYFYTYNARENIEVPLTSPLIANTCYHFEMYISLADPCQYTTDDIGIYFSDTLFTTTDYHTLQFIPQIANAPGNYPDTAGWTLVSGNYTANGGESYLIITNFKHDSLTNLVVVNNNLDSIVYCFIDDVSLTPCTSIHEQNNNEAILIYPNPANDELNIAINNNELSEIILYDVACRKLMQQEFTKSVSLQIEQLIKGIYLYEVRNKNGVIKKGKIVKN